MKKIVLTIIFCSAIMGFASAQILPALQFGIKGGVNLSSLPQYGIYNNSDQAGYLGGLWARFGALGFNFQPELYLTSKDANITDNKGTVNQARFTSLDVPLLVGGKIGAFGLGARFYGGPVVSFAIDNNQSISNVADEAVKLDFKNQNYALQLGGGVDVGKLSVDLRYEGGINKIAYGPYEYSHTRLNLFSLTLAYSIFSASTNPFSFN